VAGSLGEFKTEKGINEYRFRAFELGDVRNLV